MRSPSGVNRIAAAMSFGARVAGTPSTTTAPPRRRITPASATCCLAPAVPSAGRVSRSGIGTSAGSDARSPPMRSCRTRRSSIRPPSAGVTVKVVPATVTAAFRSSRSTRAAISAVHAASAPFG